jgi:hypothetical protein
VKGPSIAVMLGNPKHDEGEGESEASEGDLSLSETKARARDAATAFAASLENEGRDPKRIVQAFRSLCTLCMHLDELEESGEPEDEEADESDSEEADEAASDDGM